MDYRLETLPAFSLVGQELRTSNDAAFDTIPPHWARFMAAGGVTQVPQRVDDTVIAAYTRFAHEGRDNLGVYSLVLGAVVPSMPPVTSPPRALPDGFIRVEAPAARYAVFRVASPAAVPDGWRHIWAWHDHPKSHTFDFERYTPDGHIDICVGLR